MNTTKSSHKLPAKQKYIIGNWKMNPATHEEAKAIFSSINKSLGTAKKPKVIICPSFLHLSSLTAYKAKSKTTIELGAQNFFTELSGSYTGEVSVSMVKDVGAKYSIIGHSERRALGETDEVINKKVLLALSNNIMPILCIGEDMRDEEGKYFTVIKEQLEKALIDVSKTLLAKIIIAYEPVWAIGATRAMDAHSVHEMSIFIKKTLVDLYKMRGKERIDIPILYGGSVDPQNTHGILTKGDADGLLIGRQSLVPESFIEILRIAQNL